MSHYPPYYAHQPGPPAQAPIASSMYSARPLAAQSAYAVMPGHNNAHPRDHKHPQPPPKHPVQQQRSNSAQGQNSPHVAQPASSQTQMQSYQRPSTGGGGQAGQQLAQVQQPYNPPYAQTRPVGGAPAPIQRGSVPYAGHQPYQTQSRAPISTHAPTQASPYSYPAPGQAQKTYSYPPPGLGEGGGSGRRVGDASRGMVGKEDVTGVAEGRIDELEKLLVGMMCERDEDEE